MRLFQKNKSFTLLEVLIAVTVFVTVMAVAISTVAAINKISYKTNSSRFTQDNGKIALERVANAVRNAQRDFNITYYYGGNPNLSETDGTPPVEIGNRLEVNNNNSQTLVFRLQKLDRNPGPTLNWYVDIPAPNTAYECPDGEVCSLVMFYKNSTGIVWSAPLTSIDTNVTQIDFKGLDFSQAVVRPWVTIRLKIVSKWDSPTERDEKIYETTVSPLINIAGAIDNPQACPSGQVMPHRPCANGACGAVTHSCGVDCQGGTVCPPPAPVLTANSSVCDYVNLSWTNVPNETGYIVERCIGTTCTNFSQITTEAANVTSHTDSGLNSGTTYRYRVQATSNNGPSSWSNIVTISTNPTAVCPPRAPSNVIAQEIGCRQVRVNWTDNSTNETYFHVQVSVNGGAWTNVTGSPLPGGLFLANTTTFSVSSLIEGARYKYRVQAQNSFGSSAYAESNEVTISACCPAGQTNPHSGCSGASCVSISGCGVNSCSVADPANDCRHKACSGTSCNYVAGEAADACTSNSDCTVCKANGQSCTFDGNCCSGNCCGSALSRTCQPANYAYPMYSCGGPQDPNAESCLVKMSCGVSYCSGVSACALGPGKSCVGTDGQRHINLCRSGLGCRASDNLCCHQTGNACNAGQPCCSGGSCPASGHCP